MSLEDSTSRVQYATNGTTGPFAVPFYFLADSHLRVVYTDATGDDADLTLDTDYSVTGAGDPSGGSVDTVASYPAGGLLTVVRDVPLTQLVDYEDGDRFPANSHEMALDKLTMIVQQQAEVLERTVRLRVSTEGVSSELPAPEANMVLAWNSGADALLNRALEDIYIDSDAVLTSLLADLADATDEALGAGMVGFGGDRGYAAGTLGYSLKLVKQVTDTIIDPHLAPWNADNTGTEDVTGIFNICLAVAREIGATVTPSPGKYKFLGSIDPQYCNIVGPGVFSREQADYTTYGVVFLHAGNVPLIAPSGGGWNISGILFYDPLQTGTTTLPVIRPSLIKPTAPARLIDFNFSDNIVPNCFNLFEVPVGSILGDAHVERNRIYAVQYVWLINDAMPEAVFFENNIITPGVFQTVEVANGRKTSKWTAVNGAVFAIDTAGGTTSPHNVDGMKSTNNLFFGYGRVWAVASGLLNVSSSTGDTYDAIGSVLSVTGSGSVAGFDLQGGMVYSYRNLERTFAPKAIQVNTTGTVDANFDTKFQAADGTWIALEASAQTILTLRGQMGAWGLATGLTGDQYGIGVADLNAQVHCAISKVVNTYTDGIGFYASALTEATILGTVFNGCKVPMSCGSGIDSGARINVVGAMTRNTTGSKSLESTAPGGVVSRTGCVFDQASDVAASY